MAAAGGEGGDGDDRGGRLGRQMTMTMATIGWLTSIILFFYYLADVRHLII